MKRKGPNCSSPVIYKNLVFMISDNGFVSCIDINNGELQWQKRISNSMYLASPIIVGNKVYFCSKSGLTTILACENKFNKLNENILSEPIYASPLVVNNKLIIRSTGYLWCIKD